MFYYQYVSGEMLEGDADYLARFHRDYDPKMTKEEALNEARSFLERQRSHYQERADNFSKHRDAVPSKP